MARISPRLSMSRLCIRRTIATSATTACRRNLSLARPALGIRAASNATRPRFSAADDEESLEEALSRLLSGSGGRWALTPNGEGLERTFRFKTFAKTWDFMTAVALQCKLKNHHPEWSNVFNTAMIRWTTHHPKGLSAQDIAMAAMCDSLARDFGEVQSPPTPAPSREMRELTGGAVSSSSGDCCKPRD